ncbi:UPF0361 protein DC12 isogeny [Senna tora]|uniref:UPF0361 protein DC12 isogeny n=1 Tax=Senna tora TaxID=362788 RepID=A0A834XK24_9FABA|nr:UPF0361 protein DC12 isogeny [Senna tora]
MCGRARCTLRPDDFPRACHYNNVSVRSVNMDQPSYNVSPGFDVPVVRREDASNSNGCIVHCMKWGLIPSFTKKTEKPDYYKMFNARSESIDEKASFLRLVPKCRCLVAVEGFYEWNKDGSRKQPYYIHFKDGRPLVFAALYDSWQNSEGEILYTFTILTTSSSSALQWMHDRMPVILGDKGATGTWLNNSLNYKTVLKPYEESDLVWYPVTPAMGKTSFNGPECVKEIQIKIERNASISKFFSIKGAEREDSKPQQKVLCDKPVETKLLKGENDEPETEKGNDDRKTNNCNYCQGDAAKHQIKRDYEAFTADSKPALHNTVTGSTTPVKKEKLKGADDKQPTLFSYFRKS